MKINIWSPFLATLFLLGGALQYLGIISPTQTNLLLIGLSAPIIGKKIKSIKSITNIYIITIIYLATTSAINNSSLASLAVYYYYATCVLIACSAGYIIENNFSEKTILTTSKYLLILQAIATTIQSIYTGNYIDRNNAIDLISGTFYLKSDASLVACSSLILVYVFSRPNTAHLRATCLTLSLIIALNCHSKAGLAALILVIAALLVHTLAGTRYRTPLLTLSILSASALTIFFHGQILDSYTSFTREIIDEYNKITYNGQAGRLAPLGQFLAGNYTFFGEGFLTYYNPISKEWLYDAGFGTIYTLMIDCGLLTTLIFISAVIYFLINKNNIFYSTLICLITISYSFFNFAFTDLAFILTLSLVSTSLSKSPNKNIIQNEARS